jgi:ssDNA-binding Zn-finger/Zn-ribbon topoisomerase 1
MEQWKKEMIWLAIVYRIAECHEAIPMNTQGTRFEFVDGELTEMLAKDLIDISKDSQTWMLAKKGREMLTRLVGMFDQFLRFEIFNCVVINEDLPPEAVDEEGEVLGQCFDPRFSEDPKCEKGEDLRIAMMEYFVESCKRDGKELELDPHRIIFLQMLADGKFAANAEDFWFNLRLGEIFKEIEEIVESNYHWQDLGEGDEESWEVAAAIYTAGMLEQRKREGQTCSICGTPLAIFEANAKADGEELTECPNPDCGADFGTHFSGNAEYECPACGADIHQNQHSCTNCGARIDFSLPEGSVEESIETTTVEYEDYYDDGFGCYYGYTPYGWYDPWYPAADAMAFGLVCGAILW